MTTENRVEPVPWSRETALTVIAAHSGGRGPLLAVLHALHDTFGCIDQESVRLVAQALNLSRADVHGVVTFYSDFRSVPPGGTHIKICRAEACQALGGRALADHAQQQLGIGFGETTASGDVSLDQVFCLGNCALSPAVMVNGHLVGRVTPDRFDQLVGEGARP